MGTIVSLRLETLFVSINSIQRLVKGLWKLTFCSDQSPDLLRAVIRTDGVTGLLSRGLTTRRLGQERPRMRNPSGFVVGVLHLQVYLHVICE